MKLTKLLVSLVLVLLIAAGSVFAGGGGQQQTPAQPSSGTAAPAQPQGGGAPKPANWNPATPVGPPVAPAGGVLPRNETLYYNGINWAATTRFNPYGVGGQSFGLTTDPVARQFLFETLFLFNMLDGEMYPHIGETYTWNGTNLRITLRNDVYFNNGQRMTATDVANSFLIHKEYQTPQSGLWTAEYLLDVVVINDTTVELRANPANFLPGRIMESVCSNYITSKAEWDRVLGQLDPGRGTASSNRMAVAQYPMTDNVVTTGAYRPLFFDETRTVVVRNDNYWGVSKYGVLPAPRYIAHNIFQDNAGGDRALLAGEVDVSQQFISQVWNMTASVPTITTFIPQAPYYFPGVIPTLFYNTQKPGLDDPVVRRAINLSIDYNATANNAASGYSVPVTPSIMVPVAAEQVLVDWDALRSHQQRLGWSDDRTARVAAANSQLDAAGWVRGADGVRAKGGVRLAFEAQTISGWSDFMATLEVVAQSARDVGIAITTGFYTQPIVDQNRFNATFDIVINNSGSVGPNNPWGRLNIMIGSSELPPAGTPNTIQNFGRWVNNEVNQLLAEAASGTVSPARLKEIYTRLNIIWLEEAPVGCAWYRPLRFHTVNASVWDGFPRLGDGTNIPPTLCSDGYGFLSLFNLRPRSN